jgi:hypothetical protein
MQRLKLLWFLFRSDVWAVGLALIFLCAAVLGIVYYRSPSSEFGPDWECNPQPIGDPICHKRVR